MSIDVKFFYSLRPGLCYWSNQKFLNEQFILVYWFIICREKLINCIGLAVGKPINSRNGITLIWCEKILNNYCWWEKKGKLQKSSRYCRIVTWLPVNY